jgi:Skp family chaperone for outer membrane proteins
MSRIFLAFLLSVVLMPLSGIAQTAPAVTQQASAAPATISPAKLAWLNLEEVIYTCEEGKHEFTEIQNYMQKKQTDLDALRKELEAFKNQLNVQGSKLTDEAQADLEAKIESKNTEIERFQADTQKDIDSRRTKATNYVGKRMLTVLDKIAKEKGLSAVLYVNSSRDAYINPSLLITEEVIKAYNQAYPVTAEKTAAPAKK